MQPEMCLLLAVLNCRPVTECMAFLPVTVMCGPPVGDGLGGVAQGGVAGGQRQPRPQLLVRQHPQQRLRQPQHILQDI